MRQLCHLLACKLTSSVITTTFCSICSSCEDLLLVLSIDRGELVLVELRDLRIIVVAVIDNQCIRSLSFFHLLLRQLLIELLLPLLDLVSTRRLSFLLRHHGEKFASLSQTWTERDARLDFCRTTGHHFLSDRRRHRLDSRRHVFIFRPLRCAIILGLQHVELAFFDDPLQVFVDHALLLLHMRIAHLVVHLRDDAAPWVTHLLLELLARIEVAILDGAGRGLESPCRIEGMRSERTLQEGLPHRIDPLWVPLFFEFVRGSALL